MTERREELRAIADRLGERPDVEDAWLAKSFTDRLFVVEVPPDGDVPAAVESTLTDAGLRGADEVYDVNGPDAGHAGQLADSRRYRYVDCETPRRPAVLRRRLTVDVRTDYRSLLR